METKPSLLSRLNSDATRVLASSPVVCDELGFPGHYPGIYDLEQLYRGSLFRISDKKIIYEGSSFWMTSPINVNRWFSKEEDLLEVVALSALRSGTLSEFATPYQALFLSKIKDYWPKASKILTYSAGTLATDASVKWMMSSYQSRDKLIHGVPYVVATQSAFHGRAGFANELTRVSHKTKDWQTRLALRIPDPAVIYDGAGEVLQDETEKRVGESLYCLEKYFKNRGTAGLFIEYPVIAEGGVFIVADEFMDQAKALCLKYNKIFGVDCVQMFGKGWFFPPKAMEVADTIAIGKASRVPAAVLTDITKRGFSDPAQVPGKFGGTWVGLESQFLSGLAIFKIIEENDLLSKGLEKAEDLYKGLKDLSKQGKEILRPRIKGTYIGFDLSSKTSRDKALERLFNEHNTILLPAGETAIRISPRLDVTEPEIEFLLSKIEKVT